MSLKSTLRAFFQNGGRASQYELARMYGVTSSNVRATISVLRRQEMPISKVLLTNRKDEAYYQLVPDFVKPRRGRPAHKFAVNA